jgi:hypothetical protein
MWVNELSEVPERNLLFDSMREVIRLLDKTLEVKEYKKIKLTKVKAMFVLDSLGQWNLIRIIDYTYRMKDIRLLTKRLSNPNLHKPPP